MNDDESVSILTRNLFSGAWYLNPEEIDYHPGRLMGIFDSITDSRFHSPAMTFPDEWSQLSCMWGLD